MSISTKGQLVPEPKREVFMRIFKILICLLIFSSPVLAGDAAGKISVTGSSEITLEAQYSIIRAELRYVHGEIETSYQNLQQTLADIINQLKQLGLTDKEITKSIVRQGSEYAWKNNSRVHTGFYSSCNMQIRVNDIANIHQVYNQLSKYNLLSIRGTTYGRNDTDNIRNNEYKKALLAARKKAELMAATLGVTTGLVINIIESGVQTIAPVALLKADAAPAQPGGTFGSVTISAHVVVEFELKR